MAPSGFPREQVDLDIEEQKPNLFDMVVDYNGNYQYCALWGIRMIEAMLPFIGNL